MNLPVRYGTSSGNTGTGCRDGGGLVILRIDHVGIVVSNIDQASSTFAAILGRESTRSELVGSQGVRVAFAPDLWEPVSGPVHEIGSLIGAPPEATDIHRAGARLEFIEAVDETSAVARFRERRGEGLHHVCFETDDISGELDRLRPDFDLIDAVPRRGHGGLVAFLHPKRAHGVLVELLQRDPLTPGLIARPDILGVPASSVGDEVHPLPERMRSTVNMIDDASVKLLNLARAGDRRALARVLTIVETGNPSAGTLVHHARQALLVTGLSANHTQVVGITGAPGAGKSTLVGALARSIRRAKPDHRVAVLAIDPSNPFTRGALLGDRIRMPEVSGDGGIFVRSVAGRGSGDGLSRSTSEMLAVLEYVGFDTVLLETVGAGQDELAVGALADMVVVVYAPGLGDGIQALKAGLIDLAQIVVVNKADLDGAGALASQLAFGRSEAVKIVETIATTGSGIDQLREAIEDCAGGSRPGPESRHRLLTNAIVHAVVDQFRASLADAIDGNPLWAEMSGQVERREQSVDDAARRFLRTVLRPEV